MMMTMMEQAKKVFIVRLEDSKWDLLTDEHEAKSIDPSYDIASVDDLYDMMAACGYIFEGLLLIKEGVVKATSSLLYDGMRYNVIN